MDDLSTRLRRAREGVEPTEPAFDRLVDRRRHKHRNSRIASIAMAFLVVTGGLTAAVLAFSGTGPRVEPQVPGSGGGGGGEQTTAPTALVANDGEYYYSRTDLYYGDQPKNGGAQSVLGPWTIRVWFGPGPDVAGRAAFTDSSGPDGSTDYNWGTRPVDKTYGPGEMPYEDLSSLPTDPGELRARLTERSGPNGASPNPIATTAPGRTPEDSALLRTLQDLFNGDEALIPPDVRAAMFEVARGITGVETIDDAVDPVGRNAVALRWTIQYDGPPGYVTWYFDGGTKQLMAETWGTSTSLYEARIVADAGIASSTQAIPRDDQRFFGAAERPPDFSEFGAG
jgi:hypothetical protein